MFCATFIFQTRSRANFKIYNAKDKTLTAIDFYKMDKSYPENVNPLSSIFSALCSHKTDTFQDIQHNKLLVGA